MAISVDLNLNLPATPQGVPDDLFREFNRIYHALTSLAAYASGLNTSVAGLTANQGAATLVAGTITVANSAVLAGSRIFLTTQILGTVAVPKAIAITSRIAGTSFTITSADNTDTSRIAWWFL